ncbi:MAG: copper chaperone PCu(A)C [Streptosporangiaceae bacterium]|nr:copper chaperone PCu(A)C [Streptosporangiaceae bacterium]
MTVTRWTRRLLFAAVAVLAPALAGCEAGFNAPTQEYHPAAFGNYASPSHLSIQNAFVLGPAPGAVLPAGGQAGAFLALYAADGDRLESVTAPGAAASVRLVGGPVTLAPQTLVTLTGPAPRIVLTGLTRPLTGGQSIALVLDFANAGAVALQVPVMPHAYEYATYSPPRLPPAPTTAPRARTSPTPSASP